MNNTFKFELDFQEGSNTICSNSYIKKDKLSYIDRAIYLIEKGYVQSQDPNILAAKIEQEEEAKNKEKALKDYNDWLSKNPVDTE